MVKGKDGRLPKETEIKARWREHFVMVLNRRPVTEVTAEVEEANEVNDSINTGAITKDGIRIDGQQVEDVDTFDYLGARITKHRGAEDDIKSRLGQARGAFNKVVKIWKNGQLSKNTKIRIVDSNVIAHIAVLLYGCETWRMTKS
ncbi:hypothetical protein ACROYT_G017464 [Oculina patagonica]